MSDNMDPEALEVVVSLFNSQGFEFWIGGGWAVDFHLGRISRPHSDVDVVLDHSNRHQLHRLLLSEGFSVVNDDEPDAEMIYAKDDLRVDVTFVVRGTDTTVTPGWEYWPWPEDSFPSSQHVLMGVTCRVVSMETLLASKRDWLANTGEPPRPHDLDDIAALERLLR